VPADQVNKNGRVSSPDGTGDIGISANLGTNVADLLRAAARRYPERPAVIGPDGTRTWGQLDAAADAGVTALIGLGVGPGERVIIALPTGADLALALFAVARAGLIAVPIGPPLQMAVVASPEYFAVHSIPKTPADLTKHACINQRMPTSGGLYVWDFEKRGRKVNVRVDGPLIFNTAPPQIDASLAGLGISLLPEDELMAHIDSGRLVRVLQDWCPKFAGYHLYYPSKRQPSPAFSLVVKALRFSASR